MQTTGMPRVFEELGLRRIINARGNSTILGGSVVTPKVQRAMEEANDSYVDMEELLDKSGRAIADLLGIESAYVTSGCFSALAIGARGHHDWQGTSKGLPGCQIPPVVRTNF